MADEGLLPDRVFSSTAERARATAVEVARHCGYRGEIEYRTELYLASPAMYREVLSELPHDCKTVLVIGHNPGLEDLLAQLTGDEEHLSTAALARVTLELPIWSEFTSHTRGKLLNLWRPKELDPE
jgi:phosphohistidine phosphatase